MSIMRGHDPIWTAINWLTLLPLGMWLGETTAWLLGGADRGGNLNLWGVVVILPFLGFAYVFGFVMLFLVILVPCVFLVLTPFCLTAGGPSECLNLYMGFWPFS